MTRWVAVAWTSPVSAIALLAAGLNCLFRGRIVRCGIALEATGGLVPWLLGAGSHRGTIAAITLGHVIFARDTAAAARWRSHEHAHVRQYERWGVLFPIAYAAATVLAGLRGDDAYRDNAFEIEARAEAVKAAMPAQPSPPPPGRIAARH
ncbi:MAG: hypothetical protein JNK75_07780 [Betaproteobacteria bacterium]|nr:hypothetical protein [Betaproteobacteria bacterium]